LKIDIVAQKRRSIGEILEISAKEREDFIKKAENIVHRKFATKYALNGGSLTIIDSAMIQSLFEQIVREEALAKSESPIIKIDLATYEDALKSFSERMETVFNQYELLRNYWLSQVKLCLTEIFTKSKKVFESYVIGELCEKLYLDNKHARAVIQEMKNEKFIKVCDKQYNQDILVMIS
jgi:hypothetical protein